MRIAVVGRFPATATSPQTGPSRVAFHLTREMLAAGHDVCALDIARQSRTGIARAAVDGIERLELAAYDLAGIARAVRSFAPDVAHVHGSFAPQFNIPWLLRDYGRPRFAVVHTVHGVATREKHDYRPLARWVCPGLLQRRLLRHANRVVANSAETERALATDYGIVADAVIHHGVDAELFAPVAPDPALCATAAGRVVVLFVGAITPSKGLDVLLQAMRTSRCSEVVVALAGAAREDYRSVLGQRFAELFQTGQVTALGPLEQDRLRAVYAAADVCVLPSRYESFGLVGLEAMAAGKPLIVSDRVGMRTLLRHGEDGFIVPFGDVEALAGAIHRLVVDAELRRRVGDAARERVARERWSDKALEYLDLFARIA